MNSELLHSAGSGDFGREMATRYGAIRHGWDGRVLLDGHIFRWLERMAKAGKTGADPGGGAGWISVLAARSGARMLHSDINATFVEQAARAAADAGVSNLVEVRLGSVVTRGYALLLLLGAALAWVFLLAALTPTRAATLAP